jgi:hypothetical protein
LARLVNKIEIESFIEKNGIEINSFIELNWKQIVSAPSGRSGSKIESNQNRYDLSHLTALVQTATSSIACYHLMISDSVIVSFPVHRMTELKSFFYEVVKWAKSNGTPPLVAIKQTSDSDNEVRRLQQVFVWKKCVGLKRFLSPPYFRRWLRTYEPSPRGWQA